MTSTDICNLALSYLAKGRIMSMTEEKSEEARQCKLHYENCRKRLLSSYTWGFAKSVVRLARLAVAVPGWEYIYAYPQNCLRLNLIFDEQNARNKETDITDYETINVGTTKAIATDIENAWVEYVADEKDPERFSVEFVEALARMLAYSMAMVLTGNAQLMQTNYQLMQASVQEAKTISATERERKTEYPTTYADARFAE